jgi:recombinational DNA repair protein RecR
MSIFDGINHVKKSILDIISNNEASDEECAKLIKLLIDSTFKEIINAVF